MSIQYRKATKEDLSQLFDLAVLFTEFNAKGSGERDKFFTPHWQEGFKDELLESIDDVKNTIFLVAENTDTKDLAGYVIGRFDEFQYHFSLDELYVKETYRGHGIAQELIKGCMDFGKQFNCDRRLEVYLWNMSAIEFYKKHGFKDSAIVLEYTED